MTLTNNLNNSYTLSMAHIAITGATSFTAAWIIKRLAKKHQVSALLQRPMSHYSDLKKIRLNWIQKDVLFYENISAGNAMADWIIKSRPEYWIHHHHYMTDYRSPSYNLQYSTLENIETLPPIMDALKKVNCKKLIYSSTIFEPNFLIDPSKATPYGKSKELVWNEILKLQQLYPVSATKIIIPNPVGALENVDRLVPQMIQHSLQKKIFELANPHAIMQNIPVHQLADIYFQTIQTQNVESKIITPHSDSINIIDFCHSVNQFLLPKLQLENCKLDCHTYSPNQILQLDQYWEQYSQVLKETQFLEWINN